MIRILNLFTNLFPVWVVVASLLALARPALFTWFDKQAIIFGLAVIMLGMGISLGVDDFRNVVKMPRPVAVGVAAQFLIMPLLGWISLRMDARLRRTDPADTFDRSRYAKFRRRPATDPVRWAS